jgi:F-type H+-transporting ATPase subunit delta
MGAYATHPSLLTGGRPAAPRAPGLSSAAGPAEGSHVSDANPDSGPASGVSGRYATALFEIAEEADMLDKVESQLAALAQAIADSADLRALISSPLYSREDQGRAMAAVCAAMGVGAPTSGLVGLMAQNRRLFALSDVIRTFSSLLAAKRGVVPAEVRSARPLGPAQRAALQETLRRVTGKTVALTETVDETLIGGLVVKVGSKMIDSSIRSRLDKMQTAMKEAGL